MTMYVCVWCVAVDFRLVDQHVDVALELPEELRGCGACGASEASSRGSTKDAMGDAEVVELLLPRLPFRRHNLEGGRKQQGRKAQSV